MTMKTNEPITTDDVGKRLEGTKIVRMYTPEFERGEAVEGGLTIVFESDSGTGIYVMGYTELGDWVYLFDDGVSTLYYDTYTSKSLNKIRMDNGFSPLPEESE